MKRHISKILFITFLSLGLNSFSQITDVVKVEDDMLIITIDNRNGEEYKNLLLYFNLNEDSLYHYGNIGAALKSDGWKLVKVDKHVAIIAKPTSEDSNKIQWGTQPIFFDSAKTNIDIPGYPGPVDYGVNKFKSAPTVFENSQGETVFIVRNFETASTVYLAGNFNNWSTRSNAMLKTDSGWVTILKLKPGKYFYKYIVDGEWMYDSNNQLKEDDGYGSYNSAYFNPNYTFRLRGYPDAKKVLVAGSFNNWDEKELLMKKTEGGWEINMFLREGTHAYKFIVDGQWILDPDNKVVRPDGEGHANSFMGIGDTTYFILNGFTDARLVILTGSFNDWNTAELQMEKTATGWKIPYVLPPGNFEYKFIVDGKWIVDPDNPISVGDTLMANSIYMHEANYIFRLHGFTNAKSVRISGNFNDWADPGYTLIKSDDGWLIPLYLAPGKYIYKFIVDGEWILDPANPQTEQNQFGTGNSVIWIDPGKKP